MEPPAAEAAELWACPLLVAEHEYAIFFGDLNYRIDLDGDRVRQMALNGELSGLREHDQLLLARRDKAHALAEYAEAELAFEPTYKYDVGTVTSPISPPTLTLTLTLTLTPTLSLTLARRSSTRARSAARRPGVTA